ncbi:MAG: hypothetical protein AAGE94_08320 [Acidobacteriota bacterium]
MTETDWLGIAARGLALAAVAATAPLLVLSSLEGYGIPMAAADAAGWLQVRGWAAGLVLTLGLVVMAELWVETADDDTRQRLGIAWCGVLAIHILLAAPLVASKLVPGSTMLDALDSEWIADHPMPSLYGVGSVAGLDLVAVSLAIAARRRRPATSHDPYFGTAADLEDQVQQALRAGGTPASTAVAATEPGGVSVSPSAETPPAPSFVAECSDCGWRKVYDTEAKAKSGRSGHRAHCPGSAS